jgi:hypothetical protein
MPEIPVPSREKWEMVKSVLSLLAFCKARINFSGAVYKKCPNELSGQG